MMGEWQLYHREQIPLKYTNLSVMKFDTVEIISGINLSLSIDTTSLHQVLYASMCHLQGFVSL